MFRILAAVPAFALSLLAQDSPHMLLTDFAQGGLPLRWVSVNDGVMGGRSSGGFEVSEGILRFEGTLNTNGGGFASLRAQSGDLRLGAQEGILLHVHGDGRTYTMRLQQDGDRRQRAASYQAEFTTQERGNDAPWQEVWLPFDTFVPTWRGRRLDLPAIEPARINGLGLSMADGIDGDFHLEVDSISAYAPFDLADLLGRQRPFVVFAPNGKDARLTTQLAAIGAQRAGFDERDMELVVVLETPASRAGERPVSSAAAKTLRRRFGVEHGAFAVKLIGLDGGTKRTSATPLSLAEVFTQVDAMPTRRAELEKRNRIFD